MKHTWFASLSLLAITCLLLEPPAASAQTLSLEAGANTFTGKNAEAAIVDAFSRQGEAGDIKVSIDEAREDDIMAQAVGVITAEAEGLEIDKARNRWQAMLMMKADGRNLAPVRLSGRYDEMTSVPVLKRRIQSGEVISENDIDWDKQPLLRLRNNTITDMHELIGKSPRHLISQGRPIRTDEVASPAIVNKGAQVTLLFKTAHIEIKTFGEALDSGAKGEVIRVRNVMSKAVIQGVVESSQFVRVSSPESDAAEAM